MPKPQPIIALRKPPVPTNPAAAEAFVNRRSEATPPAEATPSAEATTAEAPAPAPTPIVTPPPREEVAPPPPPVEAREPAPVTVPRRRTMVKRKDGRSLYRTTLYLPPELGQKLAHRCVTENRTQSDLIADALRRYLS